MPGRIALSPRVWVLNLDAEDELARGHRPTPGRAECSRMRAMAARLRGSLVPPGDLIADLDAEIPPGLEGRAWCPTGWALSRMKSLRARVIASPPVSVLQAANHRGWATTTLGNALPRARWCVDEDTLARHLEDPWPSRGWLLKRAYTFAGRGHLLLRTRDQARDPRTRAWVARALALGHGLLAEPCVQRVRDVSLHGFLAPDGTLTCGVPTCSVVDARGQWTAATTPAGAVLGRDEGDGLFGELARVARALGELGYHGPFGIDAFTWQDETGRPCFQPRSDLNVRYTMGWALGMGARRPDLSCP